MSNKEPLYITIMQIIKERIIEGIYELGTLIPTENEFEKEFKVSKITIRKAIEKLEYEGYVQKRSGKGTTVISNAIYNKLSKGTTFVQLLENKGKQLHKENTKISKVTLSPTDELYKHFKKTCIKVTRMYYLNGEPYIYYTHYLPGNLKMPKFEDDDQLSIYMTLFNNHYYIKGLCDEFYVDFPSLKVLHALDLEKGPVLGRKRTTYGENDTVVEISYAQYNTALAHYMIDFDI